MAGIGFIIFGVFVALFGYVLITCATADRRHCTNRTTAEVTEVKPLNNLDLYKNFFRVIVTYIINTESITSAFIIHSPVKYQPGHHIEILFNPKKPSQIITFNENTAVSPLFIGITVFGIISLCVGTILTFIGF